MRYEKKEFITGIIVMGVRYIERMWPGGKRSHVQKGPRTHAGEQPLLQRRTERGREGPWAVKLEEERRSERSMWMKDSQNQNEGGREIHVSDDGKRKHVFVTQNSYSYRKRVVETGCLSQVVNCNQLQHL